MHCCIMCFMQSDPNNLIKKLHLGELLIVIFIRSYGGTSNTAPSKKLQQTQAQVNEVSAEISANSLLGCIPEVKISTQCRKTCHDLSLM